MIKKLNWAVVGFGSAAKNFVNSFQNKNQSELISISTKSNYNLAKSNIKNIKIYNDYEEQIKSDETNIIYISLINSLHKELIDLGIKYKKNIIVEKPSCLNTHDLKNSLNEIKKNKIFFKESILYLSSPIIKKIYGIINNKDIGNITKINASYGFNFAKKKLFFFRKIKKKNKKLFDLQLGGGAIYNFAHYPLSAVNIFTNQENFSKFKIINCNLMNGSTGVDEYSSIELKFNNEISSKIQVAINKNLENYIEIIGEKGKIKIINPWIPSQNSSINLKLNNKFSKKYSFNFSKNLWNYEICSIKNDIKKGRSESSIPGASVKDSVMYLDIIENWKRFNL